MAKKEIQLSDHFSYGTMLRFAFPSVIMMIFTSIYGVVDGFFISNYVGETAFAAVNLIMPYCMLFGAFGSMFGVGGSALVAMVKGQGKTEWANRIFSLLVITIAVLGLIFGIFGQLMLPTAVHVLGATEALYDKSVLYARIYLSTVPAFLLQYAFQSYLITAERPKLGLAFTVGAGVTNMVLDWLFVAVFEWGIAGAAAATCMGQCIGGIGPLIFFLFSKTTPLKLVRTEFMPHELGRAATNGLADCITNVAMSAVNIVYNLQLLKYIGEYGVSAYGVIMYVNFIFIAVYIGFSMAIAPVISFHFGAQDTDELKSLFKKSMTIIVLGTVVLVAAAEMLAPVLAGVFAGYDEEFLSLSTTALRLYSLSYLFTGVNIFSSIMFSALNNGIVSGMLSGMRMFVFQLLMVLILPVILGNNGIWLSMMAAEFCVCIVTILVLRQQRPKYNYY